MKVDRAVQGPIVLRQSASGPEAGASGRNLLSGTTLLQGQGQLGQVTSHVSLVPGGRPLFEESFLNILQARLLAGENVTSQNGNPNICSGWVTAAISNVADSNLLGIGLLALSSHLVASELQDSAIIQASLERYENTIVSLRTIIKSGNIVQSTGSNIESIMLTSMACAKYEVSERFCLLL